MTKKSPYLQYLKIPNLMTLSAIVVGFLTLVLFIQGEHAWAFSIYSLTILIDRLDGIVARKLNLVSDFGRELDSFADFFNFCIVPPIIAFLMGFNSWFALIALLIYVLSGVMRLTHFNLSGNEISEKGEFFYGFPTTRSACWFLILMAAWNKFPVLQHQWVLYVFFIGFAYLMVSSLRINKNGFIVPFFFTVLPIAVLSFWF